MPQVQEFLQAVEKDPELQQRFFQSPNREDAIELVLAEAPKLGYNITQEDIEAWEAEMKVTEELSEEQLDAVAGGRTTVFTGNRGRY